MSHLTNETTVLGACSDLDLVRSIARLVATKERQVRIVRVSIERNE
jgi:hypothetical protein